MIRNKISSCKSEFVLPDEYKTYARNEEDDVVFKVYKNIKNY